MSALSNTLGYRRFFENIPIGIYRTTPDGKIVDANPALVRMLGFSSKAALLATGIRELYVDINERHRQQAILAQDGAINDFELRLKRADGEVIWVHDSAFLVQDDEANNLYYEGSMIEISERKRLEFARSAQVRFQEVLASLGQYALSEVDVQAVFEDAVVLLVRLLEVDFGKVLEIVPEKNSLLMKAGIGWEKGLVGKATVNMARDSQAGYTLLTNKPVIVEDLANEERFVGPPLLIDHGVVSGMSVIIGDVERPYGVLGVHARQRRTFNRVEVNFLQSIANILAETVRQRQTQESLRTSEARFRALFENAGDAIHVTNEADEIIDANSRICEMLGYSRDELLQLRIPDIQAPEMRGEAGNVVQGEFSRYGSTAFEALNISKTGERIPIEVCLSRVRSGGEYVYYSILRDLRPRIQAEQASRASEIRLRTLIEHAPFSVEIYRPDGILMQVNRAWETVWGVEREVVLGKHNALEDPQIKALGIFDYIQDAFLGGEGEIPPVEYRSPDTPERVLCLRTRYFPLRRDTGEIINVVVISEDVTLQKEIDHVLRENEARFRMISEMTSDLAYAYTVDENKRLKILWTTGALEKITGFTEPQLSAQGGWEALILSDDVRIPLRQLETLLSGKEQEVQYRIRARTGEERWVQDFARPIIDEKTGDVTMIVGALRDITEQRQREQERTAVYKTLTTVMESIDAQIYVADLETYEILYMNTVMKKAFGNDLTGQMCYQAFRGEKVPCDFCSNPKLVLENGLPAEPHVWEGQNPLTGRWYVNHDRAIRWHDGRLVRIQIATDITERKQIEVELVQHRDHLERLVSERTAELQVRIKHVENLNSGMVNLMADLQVANQRATESAERLAAANRELEAFAYSVSHDLRAPLRGINGFAQILAERHRDDLSEEGQRYVDYVVQSGERMALLIEDLLQYSRMGRRAVRSMPLDCAQVVTEVITALEPMMEEAQARIETPSDFPTVHGDRTLLSQVFSNLIENAIKYHETGIPPLISITCQVEADDVVIRVQDNGIGIAPEYHNKIFDMFQRLHSDEEISGTGIGLALVKKAAYLMEGDVGVESTGEGGSTFWVRLPLGQTEEKDIPGDR